MQFAIEHTYVKYSTGDGFHVTVHHFYGIDVDEFWFDSAGSHHVTIDDAVPPVDVPSNPQPSAVCHRLRRIPIASVTRPAVYTSR